MRAATFGSVFILVKIQKKLDRHGMFNIFPIRGREDVYTALQ